MTRMIVSRTKKGMILGEPSLLGGMKRCINPLLMNESTLRDILEFRIALEIGISNNIFSNLTPQDIEELEQIGRDEPGDRQQQIRPHQRAPFPYEAL